MAVNDTLRALREALVDENPPVKLLWGMTGEPVVDAAQRTLRRAGVTGRERDPETGGAVVPVEDLGPGYAQATQDFLDFYGGGAMATTATRAGAGARRAEKLARELGIPLEEAVAMSTARTWKDTAVAKALRGSADPKSAGRVLDFGAGKAAAVTDTMRQLGYNVDAYDLWALRDPKVAAAGRHLTELAPGSYDSVMLSNVLNVQDDAKAMDATVEAVKRAMKKEGRAYANLPGSGPRNGWFTGDPATHADALEAYLRKHFGGVERGGTKADPVWTLTNPITGEQTVVEVPKAAKGGKGKKAKAPKEELPAVIEALRDPETGRIPTATQFDWNAVSPEKATELYEAGFHLKEKKGGQLVGAAPGTTRANLPEVRAEADAYSRAGAYGGDWYLKFRDFIRNITGRADMERPAVQSVGVYSQMASPDINLERAINQQNSFVVGGKEGSLRSKPYLENQAERVAQAQVGEPWATDAGPKLGSFIEAGDPGRNYESLNKTVNDRHRARAWRFKISESSEEGAKGSIAGANHGFLWGEGVGQRERMKNDPAFLRDLPSGTPVTVNTVQAAEWVGKRLKDGVEAFVAKHGRSPDADEMEALKRWANDNYDHHLDAFSARLERSPAWGVNERGHDPLTAEARAWAMRPDPANANEVSMLVSPTPESAGGAGMRKTSQQAVDQIQALRGYAEGADPGYSFQGQSSHGPLPRGTAPGSGARTEALLQVVGHPLSERMTGEVMQVLDRLPAAGEDVMRARSILKEGGVQGLRAYVEKYGPAGLPAILLPMLFPESEGSQPRGE